MDGKIKIEPKIGEIITVNGVKYITQKASDGDCPKCAFWDSYCWNIACNVGSRKDCTPVIFKKVETNMNEVKIQIPDNCELIKDGNTYIVKEKKQEPPRSWDEFCEKYPVQIGEIKFDSACNIYEFERSTIRRPYNDRNVCTSKEDAEAFLALMQLRQLRKAWVGDWKPSGHVYYVILYDIKDGLMIGFYEKLNKSLSFPTREMAYDFLECFRDLCETAKPLL